MAQIEEIAEIGDDKIWRTTCKCMGVDNLTFMVSNDDEYPEVYIEVYMDMSASGHVWCKPVWSRPFRSFWWRITNAFGLIFKGYVKVNGSFLFRGEEHIDEFCDTILTHKNYMVKIKGEEDNGIVFKSFKIVFLY